MDKDLIIEEMPEPEPTEFEKTMANITKMQDKWLEYYDEDGNLCDKDGNIIEPVVFRDNDETIEQGWKAEEVQNEN